MKIRVRTKLFLPLLASALVAGAAGSCGRERDPALPPNIVLIVADDLGRSAIGCYGGTEYGTPAIDNLAREGMRFDFAFSTPLCTPSRVELLTGRYPFRTGWVKNISSNPPAEGDEFPRYLSPGEPSLARILRDRGYATAVAGKWQLCHFAERPGHVNELGFDDYLCWLWTLDYRVTPRYWRPFLIENGRVRREEAGPYGPDLYVDHLMHFMTANRDRPFFACYFAALPHKFYLPTPENLEPDDPGQKARPSLENYPFMVRHLDRLVSRLRDHVDELGLRERTLFLFLSDNGGVPGASGDADQHLPGKGDLTDLGIRIPFIACWPGVVAAGKASDALVDLSDILPTLAQVSGAALPVVPIDGVSFLPVLRGESSSTRDWIYAQVGERRCVRDHRFKLYGDGRLFDLADDPGERKPVEDAAAAERLSAVLRRLE